MGGTAEIGERGQGFTCLERPVWIYLYFSCSALIFWVFWLMDFIASQPLLLSFCPSSQVLTWICLLEGSCYFYFVCSIFNPHLRSATFPSLCVTFGAFLLLLLSVRMCSWLYLLNLPFLFLYFSLTEVPLGSFSSGPVLFLQPFIFLLWFSIPSFDFNHFKHVFHQSILVSEVLVGFILLFVTCVEPGGLYLVWLGSFLLWAHIQHRFIFERPAWPGWKETL